MELNIRQRRKLVGYLILSALSFAYLILAPQAGIAISIFVLLQLVYLYFLLPRKLPILAMLPVLAFGLNAVLSANLMWRIPNLFVAFALYSVMTLWIQKELNLTESLPQFLQNICGNLGHAFAHFREPVAWGAEAQEEHLPLIKRIMIGIMISIPCLIFLAFMLSRADAIFYHTGLRFFDWLSRIIGMDTLWRIFVGILAGFYLFGLIYPMFVKKEKKEPLMREARRGDLMILNIVLVSVLLMYTLFVVIQFRYLFAPPNGLPYGLNFVHYARRGFFELLFLTAVNILFILIAVWLSKEQKGTWAKLTKILCLYLCAVTVVLLVSSFYRMWLYSSDDGLTRLRFLVFGFLIFEAIGLGFTFVYIIRPKFNIIAVYLVIALTYYMLLNLVPMDQIIAKNQIDRYFETGRGGIAYTLTLSPDAAPEIARLLDSERAQTRQNTEFYLLWTENLAETRSDWRQWNLSISRAAEFRR